MKNIKTNFLQVESRKCYVVDFEGMSTRYAFNFIVNNKQFIRLLDLVEGASILLDVYSKDVENRFEDEIVRQSKGIFAKYDAIVIAHHVREFLKDTL